MNKLPSEDEVTGKAKEILTEIRETFGMVPYAASLHIPCDITPDMAKQTA